MTLATLKRPKASALNAEVTTISPSVARQWLDTNTHNRPLKARFVERLARDMKNGNWRITGEAIKFSESGQLLDGQHRLAAIVAADVPITSMVIYGLPAETQDYMDAGIPRKAADVLGLHGIANSFNTAAAFRFLIAEKHGRIVSGGKTSITTAETMAALAKHPRLPLYVPHSGMFPRGISNALVGFVRYAASTFLDKADDSAAMTEVLKTGVPAYDGDAIHRYREKIIHNRDVEKRVQRHITYETFKFCVNKFFTREPVNVLRWQTEYVPIEGLNTKDL